MSTQSTEIAQRTPAQERTQAWVADEAFSRSENELKAMRVVERALIHARAIERFASVRA